MTADPTHARPDRPDDSTAWTDPQKQMPIGQRQWLLALLTFDGFLCAIVSVFFLGLYIGTTPFPIVILLAAVLNVVFVVAARRLTGSDALGTLPLVAWGIGLGLCLIPGPGGDRLLHADWRALLLPVGALVPAGLYIMSARVASIRRAVREGSADRVRDEPVT